MNKKLGPGVLFIVGIVCLYLGGVTGGVIGAGLSVGGLIFFLASIAGAIQAIARRLSGKRKPSVSTANDLDELIQNWTKSIVKAPLLVWTQGDLMSQSGNAALLMLDDRGRRVSQGGSASRRQCGEGRDRVSLARGSRLPTRHGGS